MREFIWGANRSPKELTADEIAGLYEFCADTIDLSPYLKSIAKANGHDVQVVKVQSDEHNAQQKVMEKSA